MAAISILQLEFRWASDLPKEDGLKFAVFKIEEGSKMIGHDWGFADFSNGEFEQLHDSGRTGTVLKWCELPTTKVLF